MLKLIGAVMIIAATGVWGMENVLHLKARSEALRAVMQSLEIMKSEICSRLTPIPELFELLSETAEYPANIFYCNLSKGLDELGKLTLPEIWIKGVNSTAELMLRPPERLSLSRIGYAIGRYDADEQREMIDAVYIRMSRFAKIAEEERLRDSKVKAFTGIAAGIFAVIILF